MPDAPPLPWFWFAHGQGYNLITLFGLLLFIHVRLQTFVPFSALNLFLIRKNDLRQIGFNQEWKILRVDALNVFFVDSCQIVVFPLGFLEFQKITKITNYQFIFHPNKLYFNGETSNKWLSVMLLSILNSLLS